MLRKKALVLSPFATTPLDAGQRKRAHQTTKLLRDHGYAITFLLYAFEDGWTTRTNEKLVGEMRGEWDEVIVWRAYGKVGRPPLAGATHSLDEWWDDTLDTVLTQFFRSSFYDVFVVHNVWLSKALDFAPRGTLRILDTHDVFSMRLAYFGVTRGVGEFFLPTARDEALGISRTEIALGIQPNDTEWFNNHTNVNAYCLPYKADIAPDRTQARTDYLHKDKVVFGFLGSDHVFNIRGLQAYCAELKYLVGRWAAPVELRIGGKAGQAIDMKGPWILDGYVADEEAFLNQIDVVVVPVFDGTGFKVKVADTAAYHKPMILSEHAAIGMSFDEQALAANPGQLARMTIDIAMRRPDYTALQNITRKANAELESRTARATQKLFRKIDTWPGAVAYDLTGLSREEASCVLLSWSGAFHAMRMLAKQYVVASAELREEFGELGPPGVFFVDEEDIAGVADQVWRWITVTNINPEEWGADPDDIWVDPIWHGVIDNAAVPEREEWDNHFRPGFWHSVSWDPIAQRIIRQASPNAAARAKRSGETLMVLDARRRDIVEEPFKTLFGDSIRPVGIDNFDDFYELTIQVAAGELTRLVVIDASSPARIAILRNLCAVRGVEFVGANGRGEVQKGRASQASAWAMNGRFEEQWRLKRKSKGARLGVYA